MVGMTRTGPVDLSGMDRRFFEALSPDARVELLCRLHALAIEQAEKLARDSSSRPPSSDGPFAPASGTSAGAEPPAPSPPAPDPPARSGRKPGKQRGSKGIWRCEALQAERDENHYPTLCAAAVRDVGSPERSQRPLRARPGAHGIRIACVRHRYHALECACGTAAGPGVGVLSTVPGRSRDLLLSEACRPGHLHRSPVGPLSCVPRQDPRVPGGLVRRAALGRHARPLHPGSRCRLRTSRGGSARRSASSRRDPCRRDPVEAARPPALAGAVLEHRHLPHRVAPR